ncbi:hypothetical protein Pla108_36650 [Botrimarina colliarenosi]|uniref:Alkanesulfonate transporter substrate-binding subunit n=1 Tax=Botrimarina colliarenosi TaxID=2528001 RepID=A0A5C6A4J4_9BACT|nr:hypothetical protein [Botrimarina colliarenosi]TWT94814.1 hypothetical protein Pla108_36650 [Botrimarina colliarenosi]
MKHLLTLTLAVAVAGCSQKAAPKGDGADATPAKDLPSFTLAWSEYPSWSVFGVAHEEGLLNKAKGELGSIEKELGVDVVLVQADYEACLGQYANSTIDAVCMTNMDALAPATGRDSVAVLPTSTSAGADACIAVGIDSLEDLKGTATFGLEKSVSQYAFERGLEAEGQNPADFPFRNMDPANAALAMQTGDAEVKSIMVWNPFVLQTLRDRDGSKRMFDSKAIPEEIIDMVIVGKDTLAKPGADKFVKAVLMAFYQVNERLAADDTRDATLTALGEKFSSLGVEDMAIVCEETKMYATPADGAALFEKESFQKTTMPEVVAFCVSHDIVAEEPTVGFGDAASQLNFDASFMKAMSETK